MQRNCDDFESIISSQCEALIEAIRLRRNNLLDFIRQEKDMRKGVLKDQVATCTHRLQQTTALLQFCIEALKETDSSSFIQVSYIISKVSKITNSFVSKLRIGITSDNRA